MQRIQSLLDSHKESILSGAYVELSNALMAEYKKEEVSYYTCGYCYPKASLDEDELKIDIKYQECIIKLNPEQFEKLEYNLENKHYSGCHLVYADEDEVYYIHLPDDNRRHDFSLSPCCGEVHSQGESIEFTVITSCKIVYIKKIE